MSASQKPEIALPPASSGASACSEVPYSHAAPSPWKISAASASAGMSSSRANSSVPESRSPVASLAAPRTGGKPLSIVARTASQRRRYGATSACQRAPSPGLSASRLAHVRATDRASTAARPSANGCAMAISGWTQRRPWRSSSSASITGDATAAGCTAEKTSWWKPGSVSSAVCSAPPSAGAASTTSTERPARASVIAATSPLGPDPMTTAS